jgi:RND superfamily putative drug exporter
MVIILIAFGSLLAMGLTMAAAVLGIASGLAIIFLIGHVIPAPSFSPIVSTLLGLGVGIDYALLIVTRYREQLAAGAEPEEGVATALATAGRSVLFAGATVIIAMLGLFVMGQPLLNATAVAASVTVAATVVSALTLLPALLGFAGRGIDRLRLPYLGRTTARSPMAERWARAVQRRPVTGLVVGAFVMLVLATPALSMRLSFEDNSTEPHGTSGYAAQQILADGFRPRLQRPVGHRGDRARGRKHGPGGHRRARHRRHRRSNARAIQQGREGSPVHRVSAHRDPRSGNHEAGTYASRLGHSSRGRGHRHDRSRGWAERRHSRLRRRSGG